MDFNALFSKCKHRWNVLKGTVGRVLNTAFPDPTKKHIFLAFLAVLEILLAYGIACLDVATAKLIGLTEEQAVLEFSCVTHDADGRVIEFSRNYVRNDKAKFSVHYTNQ